MPIPLRRAAINTIGYEICYTARKIYQLINKRLEQFSITPEQFVVLNKLAEEEGISQKQLALKLDKDQNTIKAIIDKLEKNGFAIRIQNVKDKRAFTLFMTDHAKKIMPVFQEIDKQCVKELCTNLSDEEIETLSKTLKIIRENSNK